LVLVLVLVPVLVLVLVLVVLTLTLACVRMPILKLMSADSRIWFVAKVKD
jgi:hypothetical protein